MKTQKDDFDKDFLTLKVQISKYTKDEAKKFAKKNGYTFGWWIGSLIESELEKVRGEAK
jgi:hypothetical protein